MKKENTCFNVRDEARKGEKSAVERSLRALKVKLPNDNSLDGFLCYFVKRRAFTPRQVIMMFRMFKENRVFYQAEKFKVIITRNREREQLKFMSDEEIKLLWPALSSQQRECAKRYRHKE